MEDKHLLLEICEAYKNGASFERICREFGGVSIYIPKVIPNAHERILSEFNGYNTATLAYKYNLSQNAVRQIIKDAQNTNEPSLFDILGESGDESGENSHQNNESGEQ